MNAKDLALELIRSPSNLAWVETLARLFDRHGLHFGHGTENARDEAYWLVRHVQGWNEAAWKRGVNVKDAPRIAELAVRRVTERKPLAYLINEAWFAGLEFFVDERVLVPRSPLAELVEARFEPWCRLAPNDHLLDIGTGSGCIAIAAAHYCAGVIVHATDISPPALQVAEKNVAMHDCADRVRLFEADLFPRTATAYRVIIANPPYVPAATVAELPAEYRAEPAIGLDGGPAGLGPTLEVLRMAPGRLDRDGLLVVEVGETANRLSRLLPRLPLTWLELEHGGVGVFVVAAGELTEYLRTHGTELNRAIRAAQSETDPDG
jgi:ribosomal protein L3 glutamine methyltransferase